MEISQVLNNLMEETNSSAYKISKETGISDRLIGYWRKGEKMPSAENLLIIANYFGISVDYLLTGKKNSSSLKDDEQELIGYYNKLPERGQVKLIGIATGMAEAYKEQVKEQTDRKKLITTTTTLKVYNMAAGAGVSTPFSEDDDYTIMQFPQFDVPTNATCGIYINGESMEPKYPNGCLVWVKETQDVNYGDVVIAIVNGEPFCKVYQPNGLYSINEAYPPILVSENDSVFVFGKVLGYYVE